MYDFQEHRARIALLRADCQRTQRRLRRALLALSITLLVAALTSALAIFKICVSSPETQIFAKARLSYNLPYVKLELDNQQGKQQVSQSPLPF